MTEVVIVEDERLTAERLRSLVLSCDENISVTAVLPSVNQAREWFRGNSLPDLLFLDIQLSDGTCFDVLKNLDPSPPVIFTTAYHEYAMKAFKFNSIDYLLKPIDKEELKILAEKWRNEIITIYKLKYQNLEIWNSALSTSDKKISDLKRNYYEYDQA